MYFCYVFAMSKIAYNITNGDKVGTNVKKYQKCSDILLSERKANLVTTLPQHTE